MGNPKPEYIYGINPAFEVVRSGKRPVYEVYINKSAAGQPRIRKLIDYLEKMDIPSKWSDKHRLYELSGSRDHQGVVVKTTPYPYRDSDSLWGQPRLLLLDNIEDPHNVGAILRSAEIFGFNSVFLSKRGVPDIYPSIVKVSAGATEFLDIAKDSSANNYVRAAQEEGYQVVALDMSGTFDIQTVRTQLSNRVLVVIGGEDKSIGQYILNSADFIVSIAQQGKINSLNASVAAGISLFVLGTNLQSAK
ncbi:23S rRNA (guanosine(2251)-2'-O)-methyltransferase RlmB [Candidatus Latescibacterota bacterium]